MNSISWQHGHVLWLLALLPLALVLVLAWRHHDRRKQRRLGVGQAALQRSLWPQMAALRLILIWSGVALALLSLARPQWGIDEELQQASGSNIAIVLDCSRSMLAEDLYPTRLEAARRKVIDLMRETPNHRMALVPFAARPLVRSPLTGDPIALEQLLQECSPDYFSEQGTAIGAAVDRAIELLQQQGDRGRAIIVFSDGSDSDKERVEEAGERAALEDIPVYGVFLGDPEREVSLVVDGKEVVMKADRETLDQLADATKAITVNATVDNADILALKADIDSRVPVVPWAEKRRIINRERYHFFLWPAVVLLAIGLLLPTGRRREQRQRSRSSAGQKLGTLEGGAT